MTESFILGLVVGGFVAGCAFAGMVLTWAKKTGRL
jgi:hypothetical protein